MHQPVDQFRRGTTSLSKIISQRRLDREGNELMVKLSPENQLLLSTKKPCRLFIPASHLEARVPGFKVGQPMLLKVSYKEADSIAFHRYVGGKNWVPTAPKRIGKPGDVFTIDLRRHTLSDFLDGFPSITYANDMSKPWVSNLAKIEMKWSGDKVSLTIAEEPEVKGSPFVMDGQLLGLLEYQPDAIYAGFRVKDAFSMDRLMRLYHDGDKRAWLGVQVATRCFFRVAYLSFDGFRLRLVYNYTKGTSTTVIYQREPSSLYASGEITEGPKKYLLDGVHRLPLVEGIGPLRPLEQSMLRHGNNYEHGRLGSEIAYTILQRKFGHDDFVIMEPAKGGKDLFTRDGKAIAQSRLLVHYGYSWLNSQIQRHLKQMTRKLRVDFGYNRKAEVGYAVLSVLYGSEIKSLVAQIRPQS